jgi:hypothetical protein
MSRAGPIVLSVWAAFNLVLAVAILLSIGIFQQNAPALSVLFDDAAIRLLDSRALATINAMALIFNACAAAFCLLSLVVIWKGLVKKSRWAFWGLLSSMSLLQVAGFASDALLDSKNLSANIVSTALLVIGFGLSARGFQHEV